MLYVYLVSLFQSTWLSKHVKYYFCALPFQIRSSLFKDLPIHPSLHVMFGLHSYAATLDCIVSFLISPHRSPCTIRSCACLVYDTILSLVCIQYDLLVPSCMISISEPLLLRYLGLGEFRSLST